MTYGKKILQALQKIGAATLLRLFLVFLALAAEITMLVLLSIYVTSSVTIPVQLLLSFLGAVFCVLLMRENNYSANKMMWMILILLLPIFGIPLYLLWGRVDVDKKEKGNITATEAIRQQSAKQLPDVYRKFIAHHPTRQRIIKHFAGQKFPVFAHTQTRYFPLGEMQFAAMNQDFAYAKKFIFLNFFIIADGEVWDRVRSILIQKAREGIEVRVLYDDAASVIFMDKNMCKEMRAAGIQVAAFNPVNRHVDNLYLNYRNHQKIAVIDGNIAYTGGTNLADEYANLYHRHGHYKDTAIRLEGDAVASMTQIFLKMWHIANRTCLDEYAKYAPMLRSETDGFVVVYEDGPAASCVYEKATANLYEQMIEQAQDYLYITTPYLIVGNEMTNALCRAARSGVDVRIVTPHIADHKTIHVITVMNFGRLLEAGVRIYEYTPGFIHAKMMVSDDVCASIGTANMDYRSLYLHYEDGVFLCGAKTVLQIRDDIRHLFDVGMEIDYETWKNRPLWKKALEVFLNLFSPLM